MRFDHQQLQLPRTTLDLAAKRRDYGEMNITQAREQLEIVRLSGDEQKIRKLKVRIQGKMRCRLFVSSLVWLVQLWERDHSARQSNGFWY